MVRALAPRRHLGLGRRPVPQCFDPCGGGRPGLLPPESRHLARRWLQLAHPPPGSRDDGGTEQQHAGEPQKTADPDERTSCRHHAPAGSRPILGCRIGHDLTPLSGHWRSLAPILSASATPGIILFG